MLWLDFVNHFLSNQRLHVWSRSIGLFREWCFFLWEIWLWVFWPFPFLFLFSAGRKSHRHIGFWLAIKGRGPLQSWFPFFSYLLVTIQILSGPKAFLYISFFFLLIFNWELFFFFCFLPIFDREFLFFFCFLSIFDRELSLFWKHVSRSIVNDFFFFS